MAVPIGVIELDETGAALDEAAGEETVAGEGRFVFLDAVEFERGLGFAAEIDEFRGAGLHPTGHLVGGDAGVNLGVTGGDGVLEIEIADGVDRLALAAGGDAFGAGEVEDGVAVAAEGHALVGSGEEAGAPEHGAATGAAGAGLEHDEAGEILRFAAEAVGDPRAHARAAELAGAGVHEKFGRGVIEEIGGAGFEERDVVHDAGGVRKKIGNPGTAAAVLGESAAASEELGAVRGVHERETFTGDEGVGDRLAVESGKARLVIKEVELAGPARHKKVDDIFGARGEVRRTRGHRVGERTGAAGGSGCLRGGGGVAAALVEHRGKGDAAEAKGTTAEKVATGDVVERLRRVDGRHGEGEV